jgi:signal peptidase II
MSRVYSLISSLGLIIIVLDQWTKKIVLDSFQFEGESKPFLSWWQWTLVHNKGLAFGVLNSSETPLGIDLQKTLLTILPFVILGALWYFHVRKFGNQEIYRPISMGLVFGGAIGNFIDRVHLGYVVDFIDWFYPTSSGKCIPLFYTVDGGSCHWPVFNVADAAVTVAIVLIALESFVIKIPEKNAAK